MTDNQKSNAQQDDFDLDIPELGGVAPADSSVGNDIPDASAPAKRQQADIDELEAFLDQFDEEFGADPGSGQGSAAAEAQGTPEIAFEDSAEALIAAGLDEAEPAQPSSDAGPNSPDPVLDPSDLDLAAETGEAPGAVDESAAPVATPVEQSAGEIAEADDSLHVEPPEDELELLETEDELEILEAEPAPESSAELPQEEASVAAPMEEDTEKSLGPQTDNNINEKKDPDVTASDDLNMAADDLVLESETPEPPARAAGGKRSRRAGAKVSGSGKSAGGKSWLGPVLGGLGIALAGGAGWLALQTNTSLGDLGVRVSDLEQRPLPAAGDAEVKSLRSEVTQLSTHVEQLSGLVERSGPSAGENDQAQLGQMQQRLGTVEQKLARLDTTVSALSAGAPAGAGSGVSAPETAPPAAEAKVDSGTLVKPIVIKPPTPEQADKPVAAEPMAAKSDKPMAGHGTEGKKAHMAGSGMKTAKAHTPKSAVSKSAGHKRPAHEISHGPWAVNLASLSDQGAAREELERVRKAGLEAELTRARLDGRLWYRIRVGGFVTPAAARDYARDKAAKAGFKEAWIDRAK